MSCHTLILILQITLCISFDLSHYNISSNYFLSSIAIYGNRAFLALSRSSCFNTISNPTLVEVAWYNPQLKRNPFFLESQTWNDCNHLQDAIYLDLEPLRSRLWVLDRGNLQCSPKIVIFNLFQKHNYSLETPIEHQSKLNCLVVDSDLITGQVRAFIGLKESPNLLVFSLNEFTWKQIRLESGGLKVATGFLALARKEPSLFITGSENRQIFKLNLAEVDNDLVNVTYLGEKLGSSFGLVADLKNGLSYYMPRDYVVVRWDTKKPPIAESYDILAQSYELLPFVSQLFTGPQNGIWALVNPGEAHSCHDVQELEKRVVKLLKYNLFKN